MFGWGGFTPISAVFDTRFIKCLFTNLPIAAKAKNQEVIQNFQAVQKIWWGRKIYCKIHQLSMQNFATHLCKTSRTQANFYKLSKTWWVGAFDTKFTLYSWFMLSFTSSSINRKLSVKMLEKMKQFGTVRTTVTK